MTELRVIAASNGDGRQASRGSVEEWTPLRQEPEHCESRDSAGLRSLMETKRPSSLQPFGDNHPRYLSFPRTPVFRRFIITTRKAAPLISPPRAKVSGAFR